MAVTSKYVDDKLILDIDNDDKTKMEDMLKLWDFKDIQSFWRFSVSLLMHTQHKGVWIEENGYPRKIAPADELLNGK